jgi:hypothetical protein
MLRVNKVTKYIFYDCSKFPQKCVLPIIYSSLPLFEYSQFVLNRAQVVVEHLDEINHKKT